jgi:hypothetical protein
MLHDGWQKKPLKHEGTILINREAFTMGRVKMLLGLLVLLAGGGTGYLYSTGYWDTWADKKDELKSAFVAELEAQGAPAEVREPFAECLASGGTELAEQLECPIAKEPDLATQIQNCANEKGAQQDLGMVVVGCIMQVQAQMGGEEQAP